MGDQKKKKKEMDDNRQGVVQWQDKKRAVNHSFGKRETSNLEMFYVDK